MKIAILAWSGVWGGLESHVVDLASTAVAEGHQVILACVGEETAKLFQQRGVAASIRIVTPPFSGMAFLHWARQFRALGADVCIFEKGTLHAGSFLLDLAVRATFNTFVTIQQLEPPVLGARTTTRHFGGLLPGLGLWWYRQRFAGWLRSLAPARTICITEAVRSALVTGYGFPKQRLPVIHNGVDVDRFTFSESDASSDGCQRPDKTLTLGTAARLIHEKGIDVAIRAFARVVRDAPMAPLRLLVANDGADRVSLERLVTQLGIENRVQFVGFQHDPPAFYRSLDIFLAPSRIEAQGLVVLEALASGCLVIASAVGGIPEMISSRDIGILVPPDDDGALARAINGVRLLSPPELCRRKLVARAHVTANFDARDQCRRILALVEELGGS